MRITHVIGREVFDSRGSPTIECDIVLDDDFLVRSSVPTGASVGRHEAKPLYDGGTKFFGRGVTKSIEHLERVIAPELLNREPNLTTIDKLLCSLDGTTDKSNLGANTLLAVSIAVAKAHAIELNMHLYEYIAHLCNFESIIIPFPLFNIINGGVHAHNNLVIQEILLAPVGFTSCRSAFEATLNVFQTLGTIFQEYKIITSIGDEGGFAPHGITEQDALDMLMKAIVRAGYQPQEQFMIALDVAASQFFDREKGTYVRHGEAIDNKGLIEYYIKLVENYPIYSIEDGLSEDDWAGWYILNQVLGPSMQIAGDDIFTSNSARINRGIEQQIANAAIIKPNQVGTVSESLEALLLCKKHSFNTIVSHRSGETEDTFIIDFAIGTNAGQLKAGGLLRGERIAKYNHLLRIEDMLHRAILES